MFLYTIGNERLAEGIYHFNSESQEMVLLERVSFQENILPLFVNQELPGKPKLVLFITGFFERNTLVFGERAYRYTLIEAGRILQNIQLICTGQGFSIRNVGEFYDRKVDKLLDIDGVAHSILYLCCIE
jgi:SagB-type dehydrogenase family enzyme